VAPNDNHPATTHSPQQAHIDVDQRAPYRRASSECVSPLHARNALLQKLLSFTPLVSGVRDEPDRVCLTTATSWHLFFATAVPLFWTACSVLGGILSNNFSAFFGLCDGAPSGCRIRVRKLLLVWSLPSLRCRPLAACRASAVQTLLSIDGLKAVLE